MTDEQSTTPRPGPVPGPRPGAPSPASLARRPAAAARPDSPARITSDPSAWGRVDDSGAVFVRTADGERQVGSWQAGDAAEGLAHFGRRFDDLATEVTVLEVRLDSHPDEARKTRTAATALLEQLPTAAAVGDLDTLATRLSVVVERSSGVEDDARERKQSDRAAAVARKEALATEAEEIGSSSTQWKAAGDRLREILDEWKTVKGIDRKTDDVLWKRFSRAREAFNRRRGSHFADLDRTRATARHAKEALVEKAEAIKESVEWNETAIAFRQLMDEWKAAGRAPREADDALWSRFKAAQDHFFDRRHAAAAERDAEFGANATAKEALLADYEPRIVPVTDLAASRSALRDLQDKWESAGKVPRDRMGQLEGRIRALEKAVSEASDTEWRRTDPEVKARAAQFWSRVSDFEDQAAKAEAAGKTKDADKARAQAAQWREWAQAAENAVDAR